MGASRSVFAYIVYIFLAPSSAFEARLVAASLGVLLIRVDLNLRKFSASKLGLTNLPMANLS